MKMWNWLFWRKQKSDEYENREREHMMMQYVREEAWRQQLEFVFQKKPQASSVTEDQRRQMKVPKERIQEKKHWEMLVALEEAQPEDICSINLNTEKIRQARRGKAAAEKD